VWQVVNNRDSTRTVNYTGACPERSRRDALNRIASGFTTSTRWGTSYAIDAWGNLYQKNPVSGKLATDPLTQTATTKNQFSGFCYDLAGNLLGQSGCPGLPYTPTYSYDAENRMTTTAGVTYSYDGDGKRVKKSSGTLYWTGMGSDALDETDLAGTVQREYVFFNGKRVARLTPPSTVRYFFSDHLGSHDLVTSATGAIQEESDYHPYGEEAVIVDTLSTQPYKFTGKERDAESNLDEFGARYYSSSLGRFLIPDEFTGGPIDLFEDDGPASQALPYADINDPQSLNKYAYTYNNPLRYTDPNGHCPECLEIEEVVVTVGAAAATGALSGAETGAEIGAVGGTVVEPGGGTAAGGVGGGIIGGVIGGAVGLGVGGYAEYKEHFSNPGAPPPPPTPKPPATVPSPQMAEHKKGARPSTTEDHQAGKTRKKRDAGGEKGDQRRADKGMYPRRPPGGNQPKGGWPPKPKPPKPPKKKHGESS
jgi:RHS repeat-associated protein